MKTVTIKGLIKKNRIETLEKLHIKDLYIKNIEGVFGTYWTYNLFYFNKSSLPCFLKSLDN